MISNIEKVNNLAGQSIRKDIPHFNVGDSLKMKIKVKEAEKVRIHLFEGTVIKKTGRGIAETFTVRKISFGEGVERTFPINSPVIEKIEVVAKGLVKRAKLYYLRERLGKRSRVKVDQSQTPVKQPAVHAVASH